MRIILKVWHRVSEEDIYIITYVVVVVVIVSIFLWVSYIQWRIAINLSYKHHNYYWIAEIKQIDSLVTDITDTFFERQFETKSCII